MFSATEFASALPYGGARANLFKIIVPTSNILDVTGHQGTFEKITLNAKATTIPPSTIEPVEVPFGGRTFRLPGGRTFDDWGITVTNDEDFIVRDFFEQWNNAINGHESNLSSISSLASYVQDCEVHQYSKAGSLIRKYVMKQAWPHTIGETSLDWAENGTIQEFEVTFAFSWWDTSSTNLEQIITGTPTTAHGTSGVTVFDI